MNPFGFALMGSGQDLIILLVILMILVTPIVFVAMFIVHHQRKTGALTDSLAQKADAEALVAVTEELNQLKQQVLQNSAAVADLKQSVVKQETQERVGEAKP